MAKEKKAKRTKAKLAALEARTSKSLRRLERHLDDLADEQRALRKRLKRLARELATPPLPIPGPPARPGPWGSGRRRWAKGLGPVVSLEVPLETDDPAAPLWATVAARLPQEITTVGDDGRIVRYRYSAAGSTPQAPRYRRLVEPSPPPSPPPSPGL
jgi:hypothetical protein